MISIGPLKWFAPYRLIVLEILEGHDAAFSLDHGDDRLSHPSAIKNFGAFLCDRFKRLRQLGLSDH
jgi:hypothetical protein